MSEFIMMQIEAMPDATTAEEQRENLLEASEIIAKEIAKVMDLNDDEVSIQLLSPDEGSLRFLYPRALYNSGSTFPVSTQSVAGSALTLHKVKLHNNMGEIRNLSFFERIKTGENRPMPIQKMMTIPVVYKKKKLGVIQICRKGADLESCGPDFENLDVQRIRDLILLAAMSLYKEYEFHNKSE